MLSACVVRVVGRVLKNYRFTPAHPPSPPPSYCFQPFIPWTHTPSSISSSVSSSSGCPTVALVPSSKFFSTHNANISIHSNIVERVLGKNSLKGTWLTKSFALVGAIAAVVVGSSFAVVHAEERTKTLQEELKEEAERIEDIAAMFHFQIPQLKKTGTITYEEAIELESTLRKILAKTPHIIKRLEGPMKVVLVGESKNGKSTLGNLILGIKRPILLLRMDTAPALFIEISNASKEKASYLLARGRRFHDVAFVRKWQTEPPEELSDNVVQVFLGSDLHVPLLKKGVVLADTPGINAAEYLSQTVTDYAQDGSVVVMVIDGTRFITEKEKKFLKHAKGTVPPGAIVFAVNRMDVPDFLYPTLKHQNRIKIQETLKELQWDKKVPDENIVFLSAEEAADLHEGNLLLWSQFTAERMNELAKLKGILGKYIQHKQLQTHLAPVRDEMKEMVEVIDRETNRLHRNIERRLNEVRKKELTLLQEVSEFEKSKKFVKEELSSSAKQFSNQVNEILRQHFSFFTQHQLPKIVHDNRFEFPRSKKHDNYQALLATEISKQVNNSIATNLFPQLAALLDNHIRQQVSVAKVDVHGRPALEEPFKVEPEHLTGFQEPQHKFSIAAALLGGLLGTVWGVAGILPGAVGMSLVERTYDDMAKDKYTEFNNKYLEYVKHSLWDESMQKSGHIAGNLYGQEKQWIVTLNDTREALNDNNKKELEELSDTVRTLSKHNAIFAELEQNAEQVSAILDKVDHQLDLELAALRILRKN